MAVREGTKTLTTKAPEPVEPVERFTQRKRPELGRYLLQVDRQTKGSYAESAAAEAAGLAVKTKHPIVQVTVHDALEGVSKIIELPTA